MSRREYPESLMRPILGTNAAKVCPSDFTATLPNLQDLMSSLEGAPDLSASTSTGSSSFLSSQTPEHPFLFTVSSIAGDWGACVSIRSGVLSSSSCGCGPNKVKTPDPLTSPKVMQSLSGRG